MPRLSPDRLRFLAGVAVLLVAGCSASPARSAVPTTTARPAPATTAAPPATTLLSTTVAPTTTAPPLTVVTVYAPWRGGALNGVTISATISGSCFGASIAATRADAWRCTAGNEIRDPCFSNPDNPSQPDVACPDLPDLSRVTDLRLTQPLDRAFANQDANPASNWILQLSGGEQCLFITGATDVVAGRRLNYGCTDHTDLYGDPDRSTPLWTILQSSQGSSSLTPVAIIHAWQ